MCCLTDNRTSMLRAKLVERRKNNLYGAQLANEGCAVVAAAVVKAYEKRLPRQIVKAECSKARIQSRTFIMDPGELLIGRLAPKRPCLEAETETAQKVLKEYGTGDGQNGHCELDFTRLFELGISGMLDYLRKETANRTGSEVETLVSFGIALEGLLSLTMEAEAVALQQMADADPADADDLFELVQSCGRLVRGAPQTFQDAVQLYWLAWLGVTFGDGASAVALGHIDRWALPFYERDIALGRLDKQRALELIECLYLHLNEETWSSSAFPVMTSGKNPQGQDITNELSFLSFEALRRTNLAYPTVGLCWNDQTPPDILNLAVELVAKGYSTPAFFGDETIQCGLQKYGVPANETWQYINSSCVEITPAGASNVWVASPYYALCTRLVEELANIAQSGNEPDSFEALLEVFFNRMKQEIANGAAEQNRLRRLRVELGGKPLQSILTRDCIARGIDVDKGGALYNWVECAFVGLANLADSLHVLREEVYRQHRLSITEIHNMLQNNFEGHESDRKRFCEGYPKYGQGCAEIDALVKMTVTRLSDFCAQQKMFPGDAYCVPGAFCWIMHEKLGGECGATPDGRQAGFPFADGCGPAQGRERKGPTASILSTTSWEHSGMIGGLAMNMKFSRALFANGDAELGLRNLILSYLQRGGFEMQVNVVDNNLLLEAQKNPDAYSDLVVRIGGYTDYFARLSPQMQAEVLQRTEFSEV